MYTYLMCFYYAYVNESLVIHAISDGFSQPTVQPLQTTYLSDKSYRE